MDDEAVVRAYYEALDDHEYDRLRDLLAPDFVQVRPDRTFEDREAFVRFMRDDRPMTDTTHEVLAVFEGGETVAVEGVLRDGDGEELFGFVDVHEVAGGCIRELRTYSN